MNAAKRCETSHFRGEHCQYVGERNEPATTGGHSRVLVMVRVGHVDGVGTGPDTQRAAACDPNCLVTSSGAADNFGGKLAVAAAADSGTRGTVEAVVQHAHEKAEIGSESAASTRVARQEHCRENYSHWIDDTASGARCRDSLPLRTRGGKPR